MDDQRLPKLCLRKQIQLERDGRQRGKTIWLQQLKGVIAELAPNSLHIITSEDPAVWEDATSTLITHARRSMQAGDLEQFVQASYLQTQVPRPRDGTRAPYLNTTVPLHSLKTMMQLRLASSHVFSININRLRYDFHPRERCPVCNTRELDTVNHFLTRCPTYTAYRLHYLSKLELADMPLSATALLSNSDKVALNSIHYFVKASCELRAFIVGE